MAIFEPIERASLEEPSEHSRTKTFLQLMKFRYFFSFVVVILGFELIFINVVFRDYVSDLGLGLYQSGDPARLMVLIIQGILHQILIFGLYILLYGGFYILNDCFDAPEDREHPVKRARPIARGSIKRTHAFIVAGALIGVGILLALFYHLIVFYFFIWFLIVNLIYTLVGRRIPYVDVALNGLTYPIRFQLGMRAAFLMFGMIGFEFYSELMFFLVTIEWYLLAVMISIKKRLMEMEIAIECRSSLKRMNTKVLYVTYLWLVLVMLILNLLLENVLLRLFVLPLLCLAVAGLTKRIEFVLTWFWR